MATKARTGFGESGAKEVYDKLKSDRQPFESRAADCAAVTVPFLFRKESDNASTAYPTPYQSIGSHGVNNLAAKMMMALFPTETWLRLDLSEEEAIALLNDEKAAALVDSALTRIERTLMRYFEINSYRVPLHSGLLQALVTGNFMVYMPEPTGKSDSAYNPIKLYPLTRYVVQRDMVGNVMQMVTVDSVGVAMLDDDAKKIAIDGGSDLDSSVEIYTHIYFDDESGQYLSYQELDGQELEGTDGSYPKDSCPWIPVRMLRQDGEDYGRSYCENYLGDLKSIENISKAILEMTAMAARVVNLVNPTGLTNPRRINNAKNGEYVTGRGEDIHQLQLNKGQDFNVAQTTGAAIEQRLNQAFLLNSAVQRNAERVTAEEVRYVARELEAVLGGVYAILTQELQLPMVRVALRQLQATKKIDKLPEQAVNPVVTTGVDAMGRGQDLEKLGAFMKGLEGVAVASRSRYINESQLTIRLANSLGIDTVGLIRSEEEVQQEQAKEAAAQAQMSAANAAGAGAGAQATASPEAMQNAAQVMGAGAM